MRLSERARGPTLEHDRVHRYTRAFRPLRSGPRRVIVGQLVAIDRQWRPHVTNIVSDLSLRDGLSQTAPACVAKLRPLASTCIQLQAVASTAGLGASPFLSHDATHVACNRCHTKSKDMGANLALIGQHPSPRLASRRRLFVVQAAALARQTEETLR
jgi:hypothetical protein